MMVFIGYRSVGVGSVYVQGSGIGPEGLGIGLEGSVYDQGKGIGPEG